jgi:hypothetical protein
LDVLCEQSIIDKEEFETLIKKADEL